MKRKHLSLALLATLLTYGVPAAMAADASFGVDFTSAYVWRGITFNDGGAAQPFMEATAENGFGVNVWGNIDLKDDFDPEGLKSGDFSEVDLTLFYDRSVGPVDLSVGYIEYLFPAGAEGTREIYAGAGVEPATGLSVHVTAYYDIDEVKDVYIAAGMAYAVDMNSGMNVECAVSAGYAGKKASPGEKGGLHDYMLSLSVGYTIADAIDVNAIISYTNTLDKDVLPEQAVDFFGGVGVSCSF